MRARCFVAFVMQIVVSAWVQTAHAAQTESDGGQVSDVAPVAEPPAAEDTPTAGSESPSPTEETVPSPESPPADEDTSTPEPNATGTPAEDTPTPEAGPPSPTEETDPPLEPVPPEPSPPTDEDTHTPEPDATGASAEDTPTAGSVPPAPAQETDSPLEPDPPEPSPLADEDARTSEPDATGTSAEDTPPRAQTPADTETDKARVNVRVEQVKDLEDAKPFGMRLTVEHAVGTGTFHSNPQMRARTDYVAQTWDVRPYVNLEVFGRRLKLHARVLLDIELTQPDANPSRRLTPHDTALALSDSKLYEDPLTGIVVSAGLRWYFPTSYESLNARKRWGAAAAFVGAEREIGRFLLSYGLSTTKYFHFQKVPSEPASVARPGEAQRAPTRAADPALIARGFANRDFLISNSFSVTYAVLEGLAVTYALQVLSYFNYSIVDERDALTADAADVGRGREDKLWPVLDITYDINNAIEQLIDLPARLFLSAGVSALHPAQSDDNEQILWPVFLNTFGRNRAANNYGSAYVGLTGLF